MNEVFTRLAAGEFPIQHENYWVTKDGRRRWVHWANTARFANDGEIEFVIATGLDMTELREASERARRREQELAHAARVGTISELAAGLAHEINQPLTAIASYAQVCVRRLRAGGTGGATLLGAFEQMGTQARRASDIIRTLREFASKRATAPGRWTSMPSCRRRPPSPPPRPAARASSCASSSRRGRPPCGATPSRSSRSW